MRVLWLSTAVVLLDQATKAAVVQLMRRHQSIPVLGDWLRLTFTENPGMAFGITIGPPGTVTVLSTLATGLVALYVYRIRHRYAPYRWSLGLILGGAVGNIIDRIFYSVILDYGPLFTGRVVDFIHVSLWRGFIPASVPLVGGSYLELFPVWNVADMAIVLGVGGVLLFHRPFHEERQRAYVDPDVAAQPAPTDGASTPRGANGTARRESTPVPDATLVGPPPGGARTNGAKDRPDASSAPPSPPSPRDA